MAPIVLDSAGLDQAYDGWYYTILGCGGDLDEWMNGYQELLDKEGIGQVPQWYRTTGKDINERYSLGGVNAFPNDLTVLMFSYEGMDVGKLAIFKLKMQDRWFTDIIDNSRGSTGTPDEEEEE